MSQRVWIWIARTLRDLSVRAYGHTWHELYYSEQCHGECGIEHRSALARSMSGFGSNVDCGGE